MFTGIVEEVGTVRRASAGELTIAADRVTDGLALGASISVNGVCLTVTSRDGEAFDVDVVPETLRRTNLGGLTRGDPVNLERPVPVDGRLDGHIVQGHIDGTGRVAEVGGEERALILRVDTAPSLMRYVVEKGFIAVDGASLTVVNCDGEGFVVTIIPHTRYNTVLGRRKVGDPVNLEVDILAKYVERLTARSGHADETAIS